MSRLASSSSSFFFFLIVSLLMVKQFHSTCIPNTSCQCSLTAHSFILMNCSQTLRDLPIFDAQKLVNVTRLVARNAFIAWPLQLCRYVNIQILDLSGSNFNSSIVDFSCLTHLIHLNLSRTQLTRIPQFGKNFSNHLQILDLSNNNIRSIDALDFQSMTSLISLFLQNNPIESIKNIDQFFYLPHLESLHLISTNPNVTIQPTLTLDQWLLIAYQWTYLKKPFTLRLKHIPFQSFIPSPDQYSTLSMNAMKVILKNLLNSTFPTISTTPNCQCADLRMYQRLFSNVDSAQKYSSALFDSTMCLMPDRLTHARLFDRRTYTDLHCPLLSRKSLFSFLPRASASVKQVHFFLVFLFVVISRAF